MVQDAYGYDANANVASITDQQEGISSRSMGYDGLDRLTAANGIWGAGSFGYDALDNLRTSTVGGRTVVASIDGANRLNSLTVNGVALGLSYDANGNLTQRGVNLGFAFDIGNRMQVSHGKAWYSYDGHGRRTQVRYTDGTSKVQVYSQAGKLLWSQHSAQGATRHVYLGDRLIAEVGSSGVSYSHTDALGSPVARTNAAAQITSRTRYEPYGATAAGINPTGIGFTGHVNDADTGLVYMQQRYYEPMAGRFLSVDPVTTDFKTGDHFNRYAYVANNPYKFKDPDGRILETAWDAASLALSISQFVSKPSVGNAVGVAVDAIAAAVPFVPGGVGTAKAVGNAAEAVGCASKTEVHHVVPQTDKRAADARNNMLNNYIAPKTDPTNKVALPGDKHDVTKRDSYVRDTNDRIAAQPDAAAIKAECCKIADNLKKSTTDELKKQYPSK